MYVRSRSPAGPLFARFSADPAYRDVLAHENAVRRIVGTEGPLRAPPVLDAGPGWLLEVEIRPDSERGHDWVDAATAAAASIARLVLPDPPSGRAIHLVAVLARRLRTLGSTVPLADVVRARAILGRLGLPLTTSHGDFQPRNVLVADGAAWVVDWELSGRRPAGYDLMQLWASLDDEDDRSRVLEAAATSVGSAGRADLLHLRYALAVQTAVGKLAARHDFDRDPAGGRALVRALPELRAEAERARRL